MTEAEELIAIRTATPDIKKRERAYIYRFLRGKVRAEIERTEMTFGAHLHNNGCTPESCSSQSHAAFNERLATLRWTYKLLKGDMEQFSDVLDGDRTSTIEELK